MSIPKVKKTTILKLNFCVGPGLMRVVVIQMSVSEKPQYAESGISEYASLCTDHMIYYPCNGTLG